MPFRIVTIGDSVPWGQGLLESQKFDALIKNALALSRPEGVSLERRAHSGATVGPGDGLLANSGEVPVPKPTLTDQVSAVIEPGSVDLVLVTGGINDVGVATILNPLAITPSLSTLVRRACYTHMLALLRQASTTFSKPSCVMVVTGYYPILSDQSDPLGVAGLLPMYGLQAPIFADRDLFHNVIVDRCEEFFSNSTSSLMDAVRDVGDPRLRYVSSGFTDANSVFVPGTSLLWGLDSDLSPQDPVASARRPQCDSTFDDPMDFSEREQCYRASAGHPNMAGAVQYANQILASLG